MRGLEDTDDAPTKAFHDRVGDLICQTLLDLQAKRQGFHQPGQFAQTHYLLVGQVCHVRSSGERQHVMLAQGMKGNVAQQDDLLVLLVKDRLQIDLGIDAHA
jgi:hypothetical protein